MHIASPSRDGSLYTKSLPLLPLLLLSTSPRRHICGWTDETLKRCGRFYPSSASTATQRLHHYSRSFPCVEVDTSTYSIPRQAQGKEWASAVPPGFLFHVKAFGLFPSRNIAPNALPRDLRAQYLTPQEEELDILHLAQLRPEFIDALWERFNAFLQVLLEAGKLGVVIFQFHASFMPSQENLEYVLECKRRLMPECMMAVEFRNRAWYASITPPVAQLTRPLVAMSVPALTATSSSSSSKGPTPPPPSPQQQQPFFLSLPLGSTQRAATLHALRCSSICNIASDDLAVEFGAHEPPQPYMQDGRALLLDDVTFSGCAVVRLHRRQGDMRLLSKDEIADWSARIHRMAATADGYSAYAHVSATRSKHISDYARPRMELLRSPGGKHIEGANVGAGGGTGHNDDEREQDDIGSYVTPSITEAVNLNHISQTILLPNKIMNGSLPLSMRQCQPVFVVRPDDANNNATTSVITNGSSNGSSSAVDNKKKWISAPPGSFYPIPEPPGASSFSSASSSSSFSFSTSSSSKLLEDHPAFFTRLQGPIIFLLGTDWEDQPIINLKALQKQIMDDLPVDPNVSNGTSKSGSNEGVHLQQESIRASNSNNNNNIKNTTFTPVPTTTATTSSSSKTIVTHAYVYDWKSKVRNYDSKRGLESFFLRSTTTSATTSTISSAASASASSPHAASTMASQSEAKRPKYDAPPVIGEVGEKDKKAGHKDDDDDDDNDDDDDDDDVVLVSLTKQVSSPRLASKASPSQPSPAVKPKDSTPSSGKGNLMSFFLKK